MKQTLLSVAVLGAVTLSGQVAASDLDSVTMELRSQRQLNGSVQELQLPELDKVREALREANNDPERFTNLKASPEQLEQLRQLREKFKSGEAGAGNARHDMLREQLASVDFGAMEERIREMMSESGVDMDSLREMRSQFGEMGDLSGIREQLKEMREQNPELRQTLQDSDFAAKIQEAIAAHRSESTTDIQEAVAQMKERFQEAGADNQGARQELLEGLRQGQSLAGLEELRNQFGDTANLAEMRAAIEAAIEKARASRPGN